MEYLRKENQQLHCQIADLKQTLSITKQMLVTSEKQDIMEHLQTQIHKLIEERDKA